MKARVRGIYATALTQLLLTEGHEVVQASAPIRDRFDTEFGTGDQDVAIDTTDDRQGVGLSGTDEAVTDFRDRLVDLAIDAFAWDEPAPRGALFDGWVTDTYGNGAEVDLGDTEGFLPFRNTDEYVEEGDAVRVQVTEPKPPWDRDEPLLDTDVRAVAGLATLVPGAEGVTVDTSDAAAGRELAGMTDLLDVAVPDRWGIRWNREAVDASLDELSAALERATDYARTLDEALDEPVASEPRRLAAPLSGAWLWFGRECRFALDGIRRDVATTMTGHHRTKAASRAASAGVDFAEALCEPVGEFPFDAVTRQFGPVEGDSVRIGHGKPDGRLIILGSGEVVDRDPEGTVAVQREMSPGGTYDALDARREAGDVALTKFREGRWWYPTVYRSEDDERKGTYVNICTPVECFPDVIRYVDLQVDVVKHADGRVERVDDDELDASVEAGDITEDLAEKARSVASSIENALQD